MLVRVEVKPTLSWSETSKFKFFLQQLPAASNQSDMLGTGSSLRCSQSDTCAIVGASGSLLNRRHGPLIDAHEVVLRPNWLRIKGYEHLVGTRTDLNLFFGVEDMIDQFDRSQRKCVMTRRVEGDRAAAPPARPDPAAPPPRHTGPGGGGT